MSVAVWLMVVATFAADPVASAPFADFERIDVPADRPDQWPHSDQPLVAVSRAEFERLLEAAQPQRPAAAAVVLESLRLQATCVDDRLQAGRLQASLRRTKATSAWFSWAPFNAALDDVQWSNRSAVFGADPEGRHWLFVDRAQGEFAAGWSLRGQRVGRQIEFPFEMPAAITATLELRVPRGMEVGVRDADGLVRKTSEDNTWTTFELSLGHRTRWVVTVRPETADVTLPSVVAYRKQLTAVVREDHLQFQTVIDAEALHAPIQELDVSVPPGLELYAVMYGSDLPLLWTRLPSNGGRDRLRVRLPGTMSGPLRSIRLEGIVSRRPNQTAVIPECDVVDGVFLGGRQVITVLRPLEVAAVKAVGCREVAPLATTTDGESLHFEQYLPESLLELTLRRPTSQLTAHTLSRIRYQAEEWTQRTETRWSTTTGSVFQLNTRAPAGWEVTDIDALDDDGAAVSMTWDAVPDPDGGMAVTVELLEALTPTTPRIIRIFTRRRPESTSGPRPLPVPRPQDANAAEYLVALDGAVTYRVGFPRDSMVQAVALSAVDGLWHKFPLWSALANSDAVGSLVLAHTEAIDAAAYLLEALPTPASATLSTEVSIETGYLREAYSITVAPQDTAPLERVLAYFSEVGGDVDWQVIGSPGATLIARRLPLEQHALWRLPSTGELWDIRLPAVSVKSWQLRGNRTRPLVAPVHVGLVFLPQAYMSDAQVTLHRSGQDNWVWTTHGMAERPPSTTAQAWSYHSPTDELIGEPIEKHASDPLLMVEGVLQSVLAEAGSSDLHRLQLTLKGLQRPLTLSLPASTRWLAAAVNGTEALSEPEQALRLLPRDDGQPLVIRWTYESSENHHGVPPRRSIPIPQGLQSACWTGFRWELVTSPEMLVNPAISGFRLESRGTPHAWQERLFGPLGRSAEEPLFLPWNREAWRWLTVDRTKGDVPDHAVGQDGIPAGWIVHIAYSAGPPDELLLDVWSAPRLRLWAWLALVASAIVTIAVRYLGWSLRDSASRITLTILLAASLISVAPWTDVLGGVMAGTVIGSLLPRRWWAPRGAHDLAEEHIPVGSTQSFVLPRALLVMAGTALTAGRLLSADALLPHSPGRSVVLVPVDSDRKPSRTLPLVYVTQELLDRLRAAAAAQRTESPAWLLQRADYRMTMGADARCVLTAAYRVLAPDGGATDCDLTLPSVTLSGAQSCLIDGRPGAVAALPGKRELRIVLPASSAPVSAVNEPVFVPHEIVLDFESLSRRQGSGQRCQLPLPRTAWSRMDVFGLSPSWDVALLTDAGGWERTLDRRQLTAALGPAPEFIFEWRDPAVAIPPAAEIRSTSAEILHVTAAAVEARSRLALNVAHGVVRQFVCELPADSQVLSVQIDPPGRAELLSADAKAIRWQVAFYEPVDDQATIDLRYLLRHSSQERAFSWKGLRPVATPELTCDRGRQFWAVSAAPELRVQLQTVENSGVVPVTEDAVREMFEGLLLDQTPQAFFQVVTDVPVAFRWSTVTQRRRLLSWQQRGEVVGSRLRWMLEADLETGPLPAYSHVLLVDRRLQIEQISVRERGAERRLRWTETRSTGTAMTRVTLWLTDPALDLQHITLTAHLPLTEAGPLLLPNVRCEDADWVNGRIELQTSAGMQALWQSSRGLKRLSTSPTPEDGRRGQHWVFEQTDVDFRAQVRLQSPHSLTAGRALYAVTAGEAQTVRLRIRWEVPRPDLMGTMSIRIPEVWTLEQRPEIVGAELSHQEAVPNGVLIVLRRTGDMVPLAVELQTRAKRSNLPVHQLEWPTANLDGEFEGWIAEAAREITAPVLGGLSDRDDAPFPEWASRWLRDWQTLGEGRWRVAPVATLPSDWPRAQAAADAVTPEWDAVEHRLWRQPSGMLAGLTRGVLRQSTAVASVHIPDRVLFLGARLDGRVAVLGQPLGAARRLAAMDGRGFQTVEIFWSIEQPLAGGVAPLSIPWPSFPEAHGVPMRVAYYPSDGELFLGGRGWNAVRWTDRAFERLEARFSQLTDDPDAADRFRRNYDVTIDKLTRRRGVEAFEQGAARDRWSNLVERVNAWKAKLSTSPGFAQADIDDVLVDDPTAQFGTLPAGSVQLSGWTASRALVQGLGAVLLATVILLICQRFLRRQWGPWLAAHPHTATVLFGAVWWICLTPSIVGFALCAAAIVHGLRTYGRSITTST